MARDFDIREELKKVPDAPGVYLMHDASDAIIYVGKAVSLRKRVQQYFRPSHDEGVKKAQMVARIAWFEYIVADSEMEALVLECNLIKEHRPKYNTMLRDDKAYPYICVSVQEAFPKVFLARRMKKDGARYFGPFTNGTAVHETIDLTNKLFRLRTCSRKLPETIGEGRPCLNHHMHQCDAPCAGLVSQEEYAQKVKEALSFLSGNTKEIEDDLSQKMQQAAADLEFEKAAEYRDLLESVRTCVQKQKITHADEEDQDILGLAVKDETAVVSVFFVRGGRMIGRDHFVVNVRLEETAGDILAQFVTQFYGGTALIPREIFLPAELPEQALLEEWLSGKRGHKTSLTVPKRGTKVRLVEMAANNANTILERDQERIRREEGRTIGAMKEIAKLLGIPSAERMEAYDISNTSGYQSVGSMVVFYRGKALRSDYRKFRLKTVEGPNDYASMREVLTRRFTHGQREKEKDAGAEDSFTRFPDLIMMDGGKGQVHIAEAVLSELGIDIPVAGMVKDDHHRTRGLFFHDVEIPIDRTSEGFALITRLQDEAHRFAIEYHRSLRGAAQVHSFLDDIPGIGPARRKALMRAYASADVMRAAPVEELAQIPGMNRAAAEAVYEVLHKA